ncbi:MULTISPECIES: hypothetical protein [unclassified Mesorhizobium]|uniref:hypothetical protein n=1 Tax=unclassified Mesorhizobium TaxID=325217 RepID=UPI001FE14022|nr:MULTISPECIES: hypothetical protein [unclassified Mesorhizobium]MDG4903812.1 hypothetical protein [Mesorhizobium sp. WSM4962]MDG4921004.1 hypothetical protein [Mesorhizobium sp. WSM4989]
MILIIACMAASMAAAETINVSDDHGGSVAAYSQRWKGLAARGVNVRIVGKCQSACTVLLGYIPGSRICVMPGASFGFHLAHRTDMTAVLWNAYCRHQRLDQRAWRACVTAQMDERAGHLPLFPQMLTPLRAKW